MIITQRHIKCMLLTLFFAVCNCCVVFAENDSFRKHVVDSSNCAVVISPQDKSQALSANVQELVQICNNQPVRTISSFEETPTQRIKIRTQRLFNLQKMSFSNYRGWGTTVSSPIISSSPCGYYVFTLRHLLC